MEQCCYGNYNSLQRYHSFMPRAAERIFIWGGKDKKGHCNVKKGTNAVHADKYH